MGAFPTLFSAFKSGRLDLSSRLVMLPHSTGMVAKGGLTDDEIAYVGARAGRHLGLVVTGAAMVSLNSTRRHINLLEAWQEKNIDGMRRRCEAVHAKGSRIFGQLFHTGRELVGGDAEFAPVAPSPIRSPRDPDAPHELEQSEIAQIIADFVASARNFQRAGYDGIELHAAHGYLIAQFLSPATNQRTDEWGGSAERRMRFLREIVAAVRGTCGDGFGLGVRLSAEEEIPDGLVVRDTVELAKALGKDGAVDYLNITVGVRGAYVKDVTAPEAPAARAATLIRKECGIPILLGQKVASPELAERLLVDGAADMIGMTRAFVADADFAAKAASGQADRIRPCVGLNQDCRSLAPHLHCAVNPQAGRELRLEFAPVGKSASPKRVAVVGGGPGGMEAARVAALRGHSVRLFEASDRLGGQFLYAASLPGRSGVIRIVDHLASELRREGVSVEFGARIDGAASLAGHFDVVVVATGASAKPIPSELAGPGVRSWFDVVADGAPEPVASGHAIFADDGTGFWFSYGATEALIAAGWRVTVVTTSAMIGVGMPHESLGPLLARLGRGGTEYRVLSAVGSFGGGTATVLNATSGKEESLACDLLVVQTGRAANADPFRGAAKAEDAKVLRIGDCVSPRRISHAMLEGQRAMHGL